jgi:hypothetical protein
VIGRIARQDILELTLRLAESGGRKQRKDDEGRHDWHHGCYSKRLRSRQVIRVHSKQAQQTQFDNLESSIYVYMIVFIFNNAFFGCERLSVPIAQRSLASFVPCQVPWPLSNTRGYFSVAAQGRPYGTHDASIDPLMASWLH